MAAQFSVGDKVRWGYADGNVYGRIKKVETGGDKISSDAGGSVGESLKGTEENPAYKIDNYDKQDGEWKPTGEVTVHRGDNLTKISSWPEES